MLAFVGALLVGYVAFFSKSICSCRCGDDQVPTPYNEYIVWLRNHDAHDNQTAKVCGDWYSIDTFFHPTISAILPPNNCAFNYYVCPTTFVRYLSRMWELRCPTTSLHSMTKNWPWISVEKVSKIALHRKWFVVVAVASVVAVVVVVRFISSRIQYWNNNRNHSEVPVNVSAFC